MASTHARSAWERISTLYLGGEVHDRLLSAVKEAGLPHPGALKVLALIQQVGASPMSRVAGALGCDNSYITGVVDVLEESGLVERQTNPSDRRVKLLHMTRTGEKSLKRAQELLSDPPAAFSKLTDTEARTLDRILAKVL